MRAAPFRGPRAPMPAQPLVPVGLHQHCERHEISQLRTGTVNHIDDDETLRTRVDSRDRDAVPRLPAERTVPELRRHG